MNNLLQHPLSAAFPSMNINDLDFLSRDITANGLYHSITIFDEMVLDGWHRYQACQKAGLEPRFQQLPEGADPVAFVKSHNLLRRILSPSQRAASVVACSEWERSGMPETGEETSPNQTVSAMAKDAEVSERTIQQAKAAHVAGLGKAVRDGKVTVVTAAKIAKLPESEREQALETGKVRAVAPAAKDPNAAPPEMMPVCTVAVPFNARMKASTLINLIQDIIDNHGDIVILTKSKNSRIIEVSGVEV